SNGRTASRTNRKAGLLTRPFPHFLQRCCPAPISYAGRVSDVARILGAARQGYPAGAHRGSRPQSADLRPSCLAATFSKVKLLFESLPPSLASQRETLARCLEAMNRVMPLRAVYLL